MSTLFKKKEKLIAVSLSIKSSIIILDEIGKMECFSEVFKKAALRALDSSSVVVGTITLGGDEFILGIKDRHDVEIHEVTSENRNLLPERIVRKINVNIRLMSLL